MKTLDRKFKFLFFLCIALTRVSISFANDIIRLFPIETYSQNIATWIDPNTKDYDTPLIDENMQKIRLRDFYNNYFATDDNGYSPWAKNYVREIISSKSPDSLFDLENKLISQFNNKDKPSEKLGYGENYRPYSYQWINNIANNMNTERLRQTAYVPENRAIAITNLHGRLLPTEDVFFYNHKQAGQGYPFDHLQQSSIWAGTPLYVVMKSMDNTWSLVIAPGFIAWVKSNEIAKADNAFIVAWQLAATKNGIAAITKNTGIVDKNIIFRFNAYIGSVFPLSNNTHEILIPIATPQGNAIIEKSKTINIVAIPLKLTPHNLATIIAHLIDRPYGWGNMYFYNDCSAELKSLFTPFAIFLPRDSGAQPKAGIIVDLSSKSATEREKYLIKNGHKLVTLINIPGHILLYTGNHQYVNRKVAMSYQNLWGLRPADNSYRAIIGKSVFFPLLDSYPENPDLVSFYDEKKTIFKLSYLDQIPSKLLAAPSRADLKRMVIPQFN